MALSAVGALIVITYLALFPTILETTQRGSSLLIVWNLRDGGRESSLRRSQRASRSAGNGDRPTIPSPQEGCISVAPRAPQHVHRTRCRSMSLEVSAPHRMMTGASACGAWCGQALQ
jgi:hypothetical protein